jgi:16S rRNA (uracil1498-N3)-methyltransferase
MSGSIRLFVREALFAGASISASPGQAHYLAKVMRRSTGDSLRLFNGRDGEWQARIATIRRDRATLEAEVGLRPQVPEQDLWLVFAPLKRHATDLLVQKATELGVSGLLPVLTDRTTAERINLDRLTAIATEAAEQSERLSVPFVQQPQPLATLLAAWSPARRLYAALERADAPFLPSGVAAGAALLVGPEGGWTGPELDVLRSRTFVVCATLGPRILRTETAAIAGLALLQAPVSR